MKYKIKLNKYDGIFLTPFIEEDSTNEEYLNWFYDPEITKYTSHGLFPYTKKEKKQLLIDITNKEKIIWEIVFWDRYTYTWIGNISLQSFNWINRSAELAIIIGNVNYHGKGVGQKVCEIIIKHAFNKLNLHRIWLGTLTINEAMNKICCNIEMHLEGTKYEAVFSNGKYENINMYSILNDSKRKQPTIKEGIKNE